MFYQVGVFLGMPATSKHRPSPWRHFTSHPAYLGMEAQRDLTEYLKKHPTHPSLAW